MLPKQLAGYRQFIWPLITFLAQFRPELEPDISSGGKD